MTSSKDDIAQHRVRLMDDVPLGGQSSGGSIEPTPDELKQTVFVSLAVCLFYISVSSSMVFVNKSLSYTYEFRTTNVLLLFQMIFTIVLLRLARDVFKVISFAQFEPNRARQVAPVSLFYSLNAAVALVALRELSVPSYTLIKRMAPLFTISLEFLVLGKSSTRFIVFSLLVMTCGTIMAAKSDSKSTTFAWVLGFMSCVFQAMYLTYVKRSGISTGMNSFGVLYYHSILSLPFISIIVVAVGEIGPALAYDRWAAPGFLSVLILSLFMGLMLNYALFLCTEKTSPTSTVVAGQVKGIAQAVLGSFTFGGVDMNIRYLSGMLLNVSGGCLYAYAKLRSLRDRG